MNVYAAPMDHLKKFFSGRTILSRLVIVNIAVFLAINILSLIFWLFQINGLPGIENGHSIVPWLAVPAYLPDLAIKPWTLITYMFTQENFFHLFFNMVVLYFGGQLLNEFAGSRKTLTVYITGGLAGAAFYIIAYNIFPVFRDSISYSLALGSSAAVLAILVAAASIRPDHQIVLFIFGNFKLKYIAIILVVMDVLSIQKGNAGGHIAHLGGALWGWLFVMISQLYNTGRPAIFRNATFFRRRMKVSHKSKQNRTASSRPITDEEYNSERVERQRKIDRILDKISKSGYETLTKEEKDMLFNAGRKE